MTTAPSAPLAHTIALAGGDARPRISVVIPTRDRPDYVRNALATLRDSRFADFEAWVMDQSAGDATKDAVEAFHDPRLRYVRMPRPGGCPARNYGAALARAGIVAFLDDDTSVPPDWLAKIVAHFDADPALEFLFGGLRAPEGVDYTQGSVPQCLPGEDWHPRDGVRRLMQHCSGGDMAARKSFLRTVGGFDELLGPANPGVRANDVSIAYKAYRSGLRILAAPDVEVIHTHGYRPYAELAGMLASSTYGSGVFWGRQLRRRDWQAAWHLVAAECQLLWRPLSLVLRAQRPRGLLPAWRHLRGFADGLRLAPEIGHVTGNVILRMEATGELDPGPVPAPAS